MSASREEIKSVLNCQSTLDRPLYMPAIYEHKAFFVDDTPSNVSRDADLLARAVLAEYAALEPDAITVGVDVYNLEAEAAGCTVSFYEGDDTSIPGISPGNHAVNPDEDLSQRPVPNPLADGRMPINIAATEQVVRELPLNEQDVMVEFDLAYSRLNEKRIEKVWLDLIFEAPDMNQVIIRDLTFCRHRRAAL